MGRLHAHCKGGRSGALAIWLCRQKRNYITGKIIDGLRSQGGEGTHVKRARSRVMSQTEVLMAAPTHALHPLDANATLIYRSLRSVFGHPLEPQIGQQGVRLTCSPHSQQPLLT